MKKLIKTKGTEFEQNGKDLAIIDTSSRASIPIMIDSHVLDDAIKNGEEEALNMIECDIDLQDYFNNVIETGTYNNTYIYKQIKRIPDSMIFNGKNASNLLNGMKALEEFPKGVDLSNATNCERICVDCKALKYIPPKNTSNCINFKQAFSGSGIETLPEWDYSNATSLMYMLSGSSIKHCGDIYAPKNENMDMLFFNDSVLKTIGEIDCTSVKSLSSFLGNAMNVTYIRGLKNLGLGFPEDTKEFGISVELNACGNLTRESVINIFNSIGDIKSRGLATQKIRLHKDVIIQLTEEDLAIATNKGWTVVEGYN